jgi:hypothetical protein
MAVSDFEINIRRGDDIGEYTIETRFLQSESQVDQRYISQPINLDLRALLAAQHDLAAYGRKLASGLFQDADLYSRFAEAVAVTEGADGELHVRVFVEPSARELHRLRWEALVTARDATSSEQTRFLFLGDKIFLSRYLSSRDYRPIRLRPRAELRALIAVSAPENVDSFQRDGRPLHAIDAEREFQSAVDGLGDLAHAKLGRGAGGKAPRACTLDRLVNELNGGYDILYLVCHGALVKGEPYVLLENEDGTGTMARGRELVVRVQDLRNRPTLVVLASCQSFGSDSRTDDEGALAALGPRLAEAGIPAIVAMQGNVGMTTASRFTRELFSELRKSGQVHRSAAMARGRVKDEPDWWSPVLFTRLRNGEVWYKVGFRTEEEETEGWPALVASIENRNCTPIIGAGIAESIMGSPRDVASRLSNKYQYPLSPDDSQNLPRVCQFLSTHLGPLSVPREVIEARCAEARERASDGPRLPLKPEKNAGPEEVTAYYEELLSAIWTARRANKVTDGHSVLASKPFRTLVTTADHSLLELALTDAGKTPKSAICPWNDRFMKGGFQSEVTAGTDAEPLVYHLFGRATVAESLVLTEDDYFDFLIGAASHRDQIVKPVGRALTNASLLFLGFDIDTWDFRVLFRGLMSYEGRWLLAQHPHVAVQLDVEQGQVQEPEATRRYLTKFFGTLNVTIFWGSVDDFVQRLDKGA